VRSGVFKYNEYQRNICEFMLAIKLYLDIQSQRTIKYYGQACRKAEYAKLKDLIQKDGS